MKIKFTQKEIDLLNEILQMSKTRKQNKFAEREYDLDEETIDELREMCSDYLRLIGYDENYDSTQKGALLEQLIDKLLIK